MPTSAEGRVPEIVDAIAKRVPGSVKGLVPRALKPRPRVSSQVPSPNFEYLQGLMNDRYNVRALATVDRVAFKESIDAFLAMEDASMEGYSSPELQRTKSVKFVWPYDHDFGDFKVGPGRGKYRPSRLIANFMDDFGVPSRELGGKTILDIGCYLGGTSLLLAAMGATVVAIEEVKKYVDCLQYLRDAFGVENLQPRNLSLYDLMSDEFQDAFDIVLFAGVLYHLSDPVLGMRITFDAVKPGGSVLLETGVANSKERILEYAGKNQISGKGAGANWFFPAPNVVLAMMDEVGYTDMRSVDRFPPGRRHGRMLAVGSKTEQVDMLRAGLSVPHIR